MIPFLAGGLAVLALAAFVPGPWRGVARAVIVFAALLSPIAALSLWFLTWERRPATVWLILPVATLIWLAAIDLRIGLTARWARPPARAERGGKSEAV